jgi:hypothetical protein
MKTTHYKCIVIILSFYLFCSCTSHIVTKDNVITAYETSTNLEADFLNPPGYAKIQNYWWWLNSNVTKECITLDLEAMKANGYGGAFIYDAGSETSDIAKETDAGPVFLSDKWMELFGHAIKEADRLGLEISVITQSGWNLGGPSVTPENAMKKITWSEIPIKGPGKINMYLPEPASKLYYKDIIVQAVKNDSTKEDTLGIKNIRIKILEDIIGWSGIYPLYELLREDYTTPANAILNNDIVDVTPYFKEGKLEWDVPDGKWTIIRYGMTCTGVKVSTSSNGGGGLCLDHLNKDALLQYNKDVISKLISTAHNSGNSLKYLHIDSWEMGVANWTNQFMDQFKKLRGYDMQPYLPVLTNRIVGNRDISNRFLHDFRRTVGDLVADEFYQTFHEIAHNSGLRTNPESGGPHAAPIDAIKTMGTNDIPMGEFWIPSNTHRANDAERLCVKQSASVAHIYGKQFVAAEGPTSIGPHWERSPKDCKGVIDEVFCSGINRIVWCTYTASPDEYGNPGNEFFGGTHLNRHVTWWNQSKAFINYMNRCSFMLSQGLFKADALYYYGDDVPNFVFLKDEVTDLEFGYDWDKCSLDALLNRVKIQNGRIILPDGMSYALLVLPDEKALNLELLKKLEKLVQEGLVLVGPKPEKATGLTCFPQSDKEVKEIARRLWANQDDVRIKENKVGKGKVVWGLTPTEVLKAMGIQPDFGYYSTLNDSHLEYIHRSTSKEEIYFVRNKVARRYIKDKKFRYLTDLPDCYEEVTCKFRVTGRVPELWDPMTGEIKKTAVYWEDNGYTYVPLHLNPEGSVFVVFKDQKDNKHIKKIQQNGQDIFPKSILKASQFPVFDFYHKEKSIVARVTQPGTYTLEWSDGTQTSFTEENPKSERSISSSLSLKFNKPWGPVEPVKIKSLKSWTDFDNDKIKYYSGSADYSGTFNLVKTDIIKKKIYLDLGNVQEIAEIHINDRFVGISWVAPFVLDISGFVKEGMNKVTIIVTNSWTNRLIGDSYLPAEKRVTGTNILKFEGDEKEEFLRKSGLTSTVKLIFVNERILIH